MSINNSQVAAAVSTPNGVASMPDRLRCLALYRNFLNVNQFWWKKRASTLRCGSSSRLRYLFLRQDMAEMFRFLFQTFMSDFRYRSTVSVKIHPECLQESWKYCLVVKLAVSN